MVVAGELREKLEGILGKQLEPVASFKGSALEGVKYVHPLAKQEPALDRQSPVVIGGDYITTDAGTGLVHTAPGHGHEDFQVLYGSLMGCQIYDWEWWDRHCDNDYDCIWKLAAMNTKSSPFAIPCCS